MKLTILFFPFVFALVHPFKKTYQIIFPTEEEMPYARLIGTIDRRLNDFTLCHWTRINRNDNQGATFSYAVPQIDNSILVMVDQHQSVEFYINNDNSSVIQTDVERSGWLHVCIVWSSVQGTWHAYINGERKYSGKGLSPHLSIPSHGTVILGQDQDELGSGFDIIQAHIGQISDVNLWDYPMISNDIRNIYNCNYDMEGNVISWNLVTWSLHNGARISFVTLPCGQMY